MKIAPWFGSQLSALGSRLGLGFSSKSLSSWAAAWQRGLDTDGELARRDALTQPYAQSAWVSAAVNAVASEIAGRSLRFYAGDSEYDEAALAAFWAAPALGPRLALAGAQPRLSLSQVLFDLAAWERLEGEFFLVLDESWLLLGARLAALPPFLIAHPQRMQAMVMAGELAGWRYTDTGGRQHIFLPEQVIHHKSFNPYDDWRGLGRLQAARVAAEGAFLTGAYIRNLARDNGDQGMVVIGKTGPATVEQQEQITAALRAKRLALQRGQAKDIFLTGDITVDRPTEKAASAEVIGSKAMSHEEVFIAFEVPPSMTAVKASYSIGKDSDRYQLITGPCQAVGGKIAAAFGLLASKQTGKPLTAELEWDDHPVMIEVRNGRIDNAVKLWALGMPMQSANDYLGLGMKPFPGWEIGYLPFSVSPIGEAAPPAVDPTLAEDTTPKTLDPDLERVRLLVFARSRLQCAQVARAGDAAFADFTCGCHGDATTAQKAARDPKEIARWQHYASQRRPTAKAFQSALRRVLMAARVQTLRKIDTWSTDKARVAKTGAAAHLLFDLADFAASFAGAMKNQQKAGLETAGAQLFKELGKDDPFKFPPEAVLDFLAGRENKLRDVPQAMYDRVKAALEEGLTAGDTTAQLSARVKTIFNLLGDAEARRIAMTETGAVYGAGRSEAMVQAGVQYKAWLTSGNTNVRAAHLAAGEEYGPDDAIPIDEPFIVDGESLMYPGDDSGSAGNVINCHCVQISVAKNSDS